MAPSDDTSTVSVGAQQPVKNTTKDDSVMQEERPDVSNGDFIQKNHTVDMTFVLPKCVLPPHEEFHPVETFVANAIENSNDQSYRAIIDCLRRRNDPPMLHKVLLALRGPCLQKLVCQNKTHAHLIHLLFRLDPFQIPPKLLTKEKPELLKPIQDYSLANAHLNLMLALVSANSTFLTPAMNALWRLVYEAWQDCPKERSSRVHAALAHMLRLCPRGNSDLFPIIASNFPFRTRQLEELTWYAQQSLVVLQYVPTLHSQLLELLMDKCLEMDVEIKIHEGGQVSIDTEVEEEMFELELEEHDKKEESMQDDENVQVDEMADKLDALMNILLEHVVTHVKTTKNGARMTYRMISPVFDSCILTTHRSKFVQFVVMVICGLDHDLDRDFCAKLIDIVLDPYRATVTRQSGACYLASFISRALYVSPETICEAVSALLRWAEAYIMALTEHATRASHVRDQCDLHALFYTVCQAAFYIMCFRGKEAMEYYRNAMKDGEEDYADPEHVDISAERWTRLCRHELQPLRFCLESVRNEFLHVANVFSLLPSQLVDKLATDSARRSTRKKAVAISTAATLTKQRMNGGVGGLGRGSNPLDSFFPFDPYLLCNSHKYIEPYYRNWEGSVEEEDALSEDEEDDDDSSQESDDDDEDSKTHHMPQSMDSGIQGMSYTSVATHSTKSSVQPATPEAQKTPREPWTDTVKRSRAPSISENGSW